MAKKYYVAWSDSGEVRLFDNWPDCQDYVTGRGGMHWKGYGSKDEAVEAFRGDEGSQLLLLKAFADQQALQQITAPTVPQSVTLPALAVDAACSKNPGPVEYRGVWIGTGGKEAFRMGPFPGGSNNIGEYLALVHALALLEQHNRPDIPVYSDSKTAMAWVRNRNPRTAIIPTEHNREIMDLLQRATRWLHTHTPRNPVLKWDTANWGEIPADYGRK